MSLVVQRLGDGGEPGRLGDVGIVPTGDGDTAADIEYTQSKIVARGEDGVHFVVALQCGCGTGTFCTSVRRHEGHRYVGPVETGVDDGAAVAGQPSRCDGEGGRGRIRAENDFADAIAITREADHRGPMRAAKSDGADGLRGLEVVYPDQLGAWVARPTLDADRLAGADGSSTAVVHSTKPST